MTRVFIDGSRGTTGLKIYDRLSKRNDIELISLPEDLRKDLSARTEALNSADIVFLCLPDEAAREAVGLIENKSTAVFDTSTAHRTSEGWAYGFPELSKEFLERIKVSNRTAVPGCYASGFIALVKPLIDAGVISPDKGLYCHAMSGYSGAGKKGIAQYEAENPDALLSSPREYALTQEHKHLKEMKKISGLSSEPIFCPYICNYYSGMLVTVPIFKSDLNGGAQKSDIIKIYKELYNTKIVSYKASFDENGFIASNAKTGLDSMEITVAGNDDRILLLARYDNLGKGASGAAIECMNIRLGLKPETDLNL